MERPMITMIANESDGEEHEPRVVDTSVLRWMAEEVKDCNVAKGWYDVNPKVVQFMERVIEEGFLPEGPHIRMSLFKIAEEYFGPRTFGDDVALLHSEASEMLEAYRDYGTEDATEEAEHADYIEHELNGEPLPLFKPEGVGSEAADVLVRLLDTCHRHGIDLFYEWRRKVDYNWTRQPRHGGKRL